MWGSLGGKLGTLALAILVIGLTACGGDDGSETTAPDAANGNAQSGPQNLNGFLMRKGEEPGFRPGALPGATPRERTTTTGVEAYVKELHLTQADARRLRSYGFILSTSGPIRGPQKTAGITVADLYATAAGAKQSMTHDLRPDVIRGFGVEGLQYFTVPGVPGARGWTASKPHVGNVIWVQGRCYLVLGNQGPGPFAGPLSTGVQAIYKRTNGKCP